MSQKFVYIYNSNQGIWYIQHGLIPIDFGTGNKGDAFMQFKIDDKYHELFKQWCEMQRNKNN